VGTYSGLTRIAPDGRLAEQPDKRSFRVNVLLFDRAGRLWAGLDGAGGLMMIQPGGKRSWYTARHGLTGNQVNGLSETADGHIWVAGEGLAEFDGTRFRTYTNEHGLSQVRRGGLTTDRNGNLWMITMAGAVKVALNGFTTYGRADGLDQSSTYSLFEDRTGAVVAAGLGSGTGLWISRFDGKTRMARAGRVSG
jgi:ligand-binding sensor domain-containing protein